jgi:phytoene/squalene synthetase
LVIPVKESDVGELERQAEVDREILGAGVALLEDLEAHEPDDARHAVAVAVELVEGRVRGFVDVHLDAVHELLKISFRNPVLAELAWAAGRYRIPETYFQELMDGVEMDIDKSSYATFDELYGYCYRVASVVGLMCLEVFEYRDARTKNFAIHLGLAFQLTNITFLHRNHQSRLKRCRALERSWGFQRHQ